MQARQFIPDRVGLNAVFIVLCFVSVFLLESQSAASIPGYLLALSMLLNWKAWIDVRSVPMFWLVVVFILFVCATAFWSEPFSWRDVGSTFGRGAMLLAFVVAFAECQVRGQVQVWLLRGVAISAGLAAMLALVVYATNPPQDMRLRGLGQLRASVIAGLVYGAAFLFCLHAITSSLGGDRRWKLAISLCAIALVIAIVLTGSRAAVVATIIGTVALTIAKRSSRRDFLWRMSGALVAVAVIVALVAFHPETRDLILPRGDSFRIGIWLQAVHQVFEKGALFGLGITTPDDIEYAGRTFAHPHNLYLSVLYQGGIVALFGLGILVLATLFQILRGFDVGDSKLALAILSLSLPAYMFDGHELIDKVGASWFLFWLPVAIALGLAWRRVVQYE